MPDNLFPTPNPAPPSDPSVPEIPPARAEHAIQPDVNGSPATSSHVTPQREEKPREHPVPSLREWAIYRLTQLGALVALWLVVSIVLLFFGQKLLGAVIFGAIIAVIGS